MNEFFSRYHVRIRNRWTRKLAKSQYYMMRSAQATTKLRTGVKKIKKFKTMRRINWLKRINSYVRAYHAFNKQITAFVGQYRILYYLLGNGKLQRIYIANAATTQNKTIRGGRFIINWRRHSKIYWACLFTHKKFAILRQRHAHTTSTTRNMLFSGKAVRVTTYINHMCKKIKLSKPLQLINNKPALFYRLINAVGAYKSGCGSLYKVLGLFGKICEVRHMICGVIMRNVRACDSTNSSLTWRLYRNRSILLKKLLFGLRYKHIYVSLYNKYRWNIYQPTQRRSICKATANIQLGCTLYNSGFSQRSVQSLVRVTRELRRWYYARRLQPYINNSIVSRAMDTPTTYEFTDERPSWFTNLMNNNINVNVEYFFKNIWLSTNSTTFFRIFHPISIPAYYIELCALFTHASSFFSKNYNFSSIGDVDTEELLTRRYNAVISARFYGKYLMKTINCYRYFLHYDITAGSDGINHALTLSFKKHAYTITFWSYYHGSIFTFSSGMFIPKYMKLARSKARRRQILKYLRSLKKKKRKQERRKIGVIHWKYLRRKFYIKMAMTEYVSALLLKCLPRIRLNIHVHGAIRNFKLIYKLLFVGPSKDGSFRKWARFPRRRFRFGFFLFSNRYCTTTTRRSLKRRLRKRMRT